MQRIVESQQPVLAAGCQKGDLTGDAVSQIVKCFALSSILYLFMSLLFPLPSLPFHKIGSPFTLAAYCSSFLLFLFSISCPCCMRLVALPCQLLCYLHLRASLFSAAGMPLKSNLLSYFLFLEITQNCCLLKAIIAVGRLTERNFLFSS